MKISRAIKQKFYMSRDWQVLRDYKLKLNPWCECETCKFNDDLKPAEEVHHIIDIDEDWSLRLSLDNLLSVTHECHSRITMMNLNKKKKKKVNHDPITQKLLNIINTN